MPSLAGWYLEKGSGCLARGSVMAAHCAWTDRPCWPATGSSCNLERPIGRVCAFFLRCETNARWTEEETGKRKMGAWPGDFLTLRPLWDQMLAGRKRKRKCSTGKVLTASAARPNARWTERGNREEKNGSLTGRFSHTASAVRPNARWTKEKT